MRSWFSTGRHEALPKSHRTDCKNDIQTIVTMNPSPKTIELRSNKVR